ncbi:hypothetical protein [Curtobacterium sp. NPDC090223]|uniref:hypothetical protein n=1 Tax=Curtobacterium sp. NPDC090223 TaxID=3363972 RepID=UPI003805D07E
MDEDDAIAAPCDAVDGFAVPTTEPTALAFVELSAFAAACAAALDELPGSVSAFCVTFDDAAVSWFPAISAAAFAEMSAAADAADVPSSFAAACAAATAAGLLFPSASADADADADAFRFPFASADAFVDDVPTAAPFDAEFGDAFAATEPAPFVFDELSSFAAPFAATFAELLGLAAVLAVAAVEASGFAAARAAVFAEMSCAADACEVASLLPAT